MPKFLSYNSFQIFCHKFFYRMNHLWGKYIGFKNVFKRPETNAQQSSELIYEALSSEEPCMIARFGSTELFCLSNYLGIKQGWSNAIGFIRGSAEPWWWIPERVNNMRDFSGFFPINEDSIVKFCEMMLRDTQELDILGSWLVKEKNLSELLLNKHKIFLPYLEPWYSDKPWTRALEGKHIVVVHPFAEQIERQYFKNRQFLFKNPEILPEFKLRTVRAVQSLGGENEQNFSSWFSALKWMLSEVVKEDFDICLIGCGAYGFPLAASIKRLGKKAFHLGGALQLLFGIKGNRWEDVNYGVKEWGIPANYYNDMFNEFWEKPDKTTRPRNAEQVEGACYW